MRKKFVNLGMAAVLAANLFFSGGQALAGGYCQLLQPPSEGMVLPPGVPALKDLLKKKSGPDEIVSALLDPVAPMTAEQLEGVYTHVLEFIASKYIEESKLAHLDEYRTKYAGKIKTRKDLDNAIEDLIGSMNDRWTWVVTPSEQIRQVLRFVAKQVNFGVGLRKSASGGYEIESVHYGTAAQYSGLREGDRIISVNGKEIAAMSKSDAEALFHGQIGALIKIKSVQDGKEVDASYALAAPLPNKPDAKVLENNLAYLKLPSFMSEEVFNKLVSQLIGMAQNTPGGLQGMVLDLRYNGGGQVDMAKHLIQLLLSQGVAIQEVSRDGRTVVETKTTYLPLGAFAKLKFSQEELAVLKDLQTLPLVILVNGSSASASEIVTGALMESRKNTTVLGEQTFGKFEQMYVFDLPNCAKVAVTAGKYTTPSGKWLQEAGITPDIIVHQPRGGKEDKQMEAAIKLLKDKTGLNPSNVVQMDPEAKPILGPAPVRPQEVVKKDWSEVISEHRVLIMQGGVAAALLSLLAAYLLLSRRKED